MKIFSGKKAQSGVAMLMAMVTMLILTVLAGELVYQSQVYSGLVFRQRDQLRASLLARSGLRLAVLQLRAAKKAKEKAKSLGLGDDNSLTSKIWQTPLVLPPPIPAGLDLNSRQPLEEFTKALGIEGTITTNISADNDRVSLNQLVWLKPNATPSSGANPNPTTGANPNPGYHGGDAVGTTLAPEEQERALKESRKDFAQLLQDLLEKKRLGDDSFREKYPNLTGEQLMGNILAWMDPKTTVDGEQRDKNDYYTRAQPTPYSPKEAPFVSMTELPMVKGIDDTLAKLLSDNFTTLASTSLDVNKAAPLLLHAFIPELTPDALEKVVKRRTDDTQGGPFKSDKDFWAYLNTIGQYQDAQKRLTDRGIQVLGEETGYRVVVTAQSGSARKIWVAEVGPLPPNSDAKNTPTLPGGSPPPIPTTQGDGSSKDSNNPNSSGSTGPQNNDSETLGIVYLKAE